MEPIRSRARPRQQAHTMYVCRAGTWYVDCASVLPHVSSERGRTTICACTTYIYVCERYAKIAE
eukprot:5815924-Prymnesium_polylepis.1